MNTDVWIRLTWALVCIGFGLAIYAFSNRFMLARARGKKATALLFKSGKPALLYFTTPTCAPCKTIQRPAIQSLQERLGDRLQIVEIDASASPDVADEWGVLSVPTTFIIDAKGQPRHVNQGVATVEKLWRQIQSLNDGG